MLLLDTRIHLFLNNNIYSESIDMWGIGTVLFTILIGEPPFTE